MPLPSKRSRIDKIRLENFKVRKIGRGRYSIWLKVDHQSFQFCQEGFFGSKEHVNWTIRQAAIALNRFKFGD